MSVESEIKQILEQGRIKAQSEMSRGRMARTDPEKAAAPGAAALMLANANGEAIVRLARELDKLQRSVG